VKLLRGFYRQETPMELGQPITGVSMIGISDEVANVERD
jgi:hypothetical protein